MPLVLDDPTLVGLLGVFIPVFGGAVTIAYRLHRAKVKAELANHNLRTQVSNLSKQSDELKAKVAQLDEKLHGLSKEVSSTSSGFYGFMRGRNDGIIEATRRGIGREREENNS